MGKPQSNNQLAAKGVGRGVALHPAKARAKFGDSGFYFLIAGIMTEPEWRKIRAQVLVWQRERKEKQP